MSDRERIFSLQYQYNIKHRSNENKVKYQIGDYKLIQYQILKIDYTPRSDQ